ncbi:MAG: alpha/beta hydrolase [Bacteroidota bacterium]
MKWWYLLVGLIGCYAILVVGANLLLPRFLFLPTQLKSDYQFQFSQLFEEVWLEEGAFRIHGLHFPVDSAAGLVLYFHGNADDLQRWGEYLTDLTEKGYAVLAIDYPGYGKSPGKPSEEGIYQATELAWQWALERYSPDQIVIYGRSLGSGAASYLSSQHAAQVLILETPFYSVPDVLRERFSIGIWWNDQYQFPNNQHIEQSQNEVFIFQGTSDRVVPYRSAIKLRPLLQSENHFIIIDGGTHHNLSKFPLYHEQLTQILESTRTPESNPAP